MATIILVCAQSGRVVITAAPSLAADTLETREETWLPKASAYLPTCWVPWLSLEMLLPHSSVIPGVFICWNWERPSTKTDDWFVLSKQNQALYPDKWYIHTLVFFFALFQTSQNMLSVGSLKWLLLFLY